MMLLVTLIMLDYEPSLIRSSSPDPLRKSGFILKSVINSCPSTTVALLPD